MTLDLHTAGPDLGLDAWVARRSARPDGPVLDENRGQGRRFAFYGRTSTTGYQDRWSSCGWQREVAETLVAGWGAVVREFFDVGCPRRSPWSRRPQAAALLAEARTATASFDAVVMGEYERAFASNKQFATVAARLAEDGIEVWLPEAGGRVDPGSSEHRALLEVLGAQSQREVLRARHRVLAAMQAQVREQGRYLGGRPPYGYRLVDGGPHPNRAQAQWGRRLQKLAPNPVTAPQVRWMFAQRRAGRSLASFARELTEAGIPCPSDVDSGRNPHRRGGAWTLRTVAVILGNPRYTGRQVWNRQPGDRAGARDPRSIAAQEWAISVEAAHPALVSEEDFVAVQDIRAARPTKDGCPRRYVLSGLVRCALCQRRLDAHWVHGRGGYRCRHGHRSAITRSPDAPRYLYVREDVLLAELAAQLSPEREREGEVADATAIVSRVRGTGMVIVHDGAGWSLEPT